MSVIPEPRLFRIHILQRAYSASQKDLPYLEERIYLLRVLVSNSAIQHRAPPPDVDVISLAQHHYDLGGALYDRYLHTQEPTDIEDAELHLRLALSSHSLPTSLGPSCVLGSVLRTSTSLSMNMQRLDEALSLHRQSFADSNAGCVHILQQAHCSRELGLTLLWYGRQTSDEHALRESILHLIAAHNMYTDMKVADPSSCRGLSVAFEGLYGIQLDPDRANLEDAVSYGRLSLTLCGPTHRDLYHAASSLTNVLSNLFAVSSNLESLDEAIALYRALIGSAPPRWAKILTIGLITRLNIRVSVLNSEEDLVEVISHTTELLAMSGTDDPYWPDLQEAISLSLHSRFIMAGAQEDIEASARAARSAASASTGTMYHGVRLTQYAGCRLEQYAAFGDVAHLDESIAIYEGVIQTAPPGDFQTGIQAAASLLVACHYRYGVRGDAADLDRAIKMLPSLTAAGEHMGMNAVYNSFRGGNVLVSRYLVTGALEDLDQATMLHQEAAASAQDFAQHSHEVLNAYATTLRIRHEALNEGESAMQALELHHKALSALSGVHPGRPEVMCGLARLRLCAGSTVGDITEALRLLLDAINNRYCPAYRRLKYASDVLTYFATHKPVLSDEHALKLSVVYLGAIDLLPQVASFGLVPRARLSVIAGMGKLTIQGATHAISIGRLDQALEMLEAGRSIFWTQGLRLRTPFTNLPKTIGDRLTKITSALAQPPREEADEDRELSSRTKLGDEFQTVLAEARLEPGFHDLLRNTSFESLTKAAECHPLVVFLGNDASGHAIIVSGNAQCRVVGLPGATTEVLQALSLRIDKHTKTVRDSRGMKILKKGNAQPTAMYRELWTLIMAPIVDALKWPVAQARKRRRLTLCPTGVFMLLPLHAAGVYTGRNQVCCSDYFVASYTPSVGALLHAQQSFQPVRRSSDTETLVVAVDQPCQGVPLPEAIKEANIVREHASPSKILQVSTTDGVLEHIQTASILHLACHGTQNLSDALQSGFHLEDGMLTISKLTELELPRAFLAVLDACETAKGDTVQPDQAIHLAGAMLFAGFKSVVATMWSMRDREGPVIAKSIYSALFEAGATSEYLNPDDVPYALDDAVRKLRVSGLDPSFWATYVHIGI